MLVADSLTQTRWGKTLFRDLGFCLLYGSLTVLLGKNAAAKEALLAVLAGETGPRRGMVRFEGQPVLASDEYHALVAHIGAKSDLPSRLSVRESIRRHIPPDGAVELADAAMQYFRLTPFADRPCGKLPPHLQRRAAYARLLALPCPIWLLHHKVEFLDVEGNELFYKLVSDRCNQDGIVVIAADNADFITPNLPLDLGDFA